MVLERKPMRVGALASRGGEVRVATDDVKQIVFGADQFRLGEIEVRRVLLAVGRELNQCLATDLKTFEDLLLRAEHKVSRIIDPGKRFGVLPSGVGQFVVDLDQLGLGNVAA